MGSAERRHGEILSGPRQWQEFLSALGYTPGQIDLQLLFETWPLPPRMTRHYARQIDWTNPADPLYRMIVPTQSERVISPYELNDPIGDYAHEKHPGLIHRYPDRVLLWPTLACSVHCRFCFRREEISKPPAINWPLVSEYLREHTEVSEVILSGGDPATLPETHLERIVTRLGAVPHLKMLRLHSRALAAQPESVSADDIEILRSFRYGREDRTVTWIHHLNHAQEMSLESEDLAARLNRAAIRQQSQSVLLRGVNDDSETLADLFQTLASHGIQPKYLHHLDQAQGIDHFRLSIAAGLELYAQLQTRLSREICPQYILDLPGGKGKVPVVSMQEEQDGVYLARSPLTGESVRYRDPAVSDGHGTSGNRSLR